MDILSMLFGQLIENIFVILFLLNGIVFSHDGMVFSN